MYFLSSPNVSYDTTESLKKKSVSYWASLGLIMWKHCHVLQFISTIKPYILMTYFNKTHYVQFFFSIREI